MSEPVKERLYSLLPAIYRQRDAEQGEPLRALMAVIETEVQALEKDISGMYDDWFIETCSDWVVPYIGDLLGATVLHPLPNFSLRSYVANTVAYRRRKGTATIIEQMARDVTGWSAHAVEFFQHLSVSQNLSHIRPGNQQIPDLRDTRALELLGKPFETAAYTADVRSISLGRGRYNLPNIGIFLWRLQSYPLINVTAREKEGLDIITPAFTFDPTGFDIPLFNRPQAEKDISHLAEEINLPGPLRLRPLYDELETLRQGGTANAPYFGDDPAFKISLIYKGKAEASDLEPSEIAVCDLSEWRVPQHVHDKFKASVDPTRGRILFLDKTLFPDNTMIPDGASPSDGPRPEVLVSYSYGFSGDVGAGAYDRTSILRQYLDLDLDWQAFVSKEMGYGGIDGGIFKSLEDALTEWNKQPEGTFGIIAVMDNRTYTRSCDNYTCTWDDYIVNIPRGSRLLIIAASLTKGEYFNSQPETKKLNLLSYLSARELRPHILGNIQIKISEDSSSETAPVDSSSVTAPGDLIIDGMLIEGLITVKNGDLSSLQISHCTLRGIEGPIRTEMMHEESELPGSGVRYLPEINRFWGIETVIPSPVEPVGGDAMQLKLSQTICGMIDLPGSAQLNISDSIIDPKIGQSEYFDGEDGEISPMVIEGNIYYLYSPRLNAQEADAKIERSTIICASNFHSLEASDSIFTETVKVKNRQKGCVRFCYMPEGSSPQRRFKCQPDLAIAMNEAQLPAGKHLTPEEKNQLLVRLKPVFAGKEYGDPAYGQLSDASAEEILTGAEDGSEMGAFCSLLRPQREANLRMALEEYLRFGMEAGIFYVT